MAALINSTTSPVVCTIASARAIGDLQQFLASVEPACGLAFVVVLREDARQDPQLADVLGRSCILPVIEAQPGTPCEAECVYLIPEFCKPTIEAGYLQFKAIPEGTTSEAAIDGFLLSLAVDQAENAACVVLSGSGSDSSLGVRAMKHHGGLCLAQSEPKRGRSVRNSSIASFADLVLPVDELYRRLLEHFERRRDPDLADGSLLLRKAIHARISEIHDILRIRTGHDFSGYRDSRAVQRIERRLHILQLSDVEAFILQLKQDPHEADFLFADLLFTLTEFFGGNESFEALARHVVPQILADRVPGQPIRIWVAACATGEEAYAIGMIFQELIPQGEKIEIQIFASDIDERSLAIARMGRYSTAIEEKVSPERLGRFFVREDGAYRISGKLRDTCLFARHDLLQDPPFSRMDLVVCRNLLIQLNNDLQQKLVSLFQFALREGGYLFTGESENVTIGASFKTIDPAHRIFRRTNSAQSMQSRTLIATRAPAPRLLPLQPVGATENLQNIAEQQIADLFAPAHLIVSAGGKLLYTSERSDKYLELAQAKHDDSVFHLIREELRVELQAAFERAVATHGAAVSRATLSQSDGKVRTIDLTVQPLNKSDMPYLHYLVLLRDVESVVANGRLEADHSNDPAHAGIRQLELELRAAREVQRISTEELKLSNEKLSSANEEMSSLNEELQIVNAELYVRLDDLSSALSDTHNLLASTQIAVIFLDCRLRVRLFTPAAIAFYNLTANDLGRPISNLRPLISGSSLEDDAEKVMETLEPSDRQVYSLNSETSYRMKILPYRTAEDKIGGVVVTYTPDLALR